MSARLSRFWGHALSLSTSSKRRVEHRGDDDQAPDEVEGEQQCSSDAESAVGVGAILDET